MKNILLIIRWTVGVLFIFSGLIKANDPLGLSYKMQEFFEVWGWTSLNDYTLAMSVGMNVFEVVAGFAVIIGWRMRIFSWLLLLLIIFFTFLTGYALFSGKIKTCGCFGDCLPLTPAQSFGKDIFLLVLILVLFMARKKIEPSIKAFLAFILLFSVTTFTTYGQFYSLKYLPFVDCLPYKPGNNLIEQMKMPEGAVPDSFSFVFSYEKDGKKLEFDQSGFPDDFDSTYLFIGRNDKLVKKGNGLQPKIIDFSLMTPDGMDTTTEIFGQPNPYILVFAKDMDNIDKWKPGFEKIVNAAEQKQVPVIMVTADPGRAQELFTNISILKCDATVMKTAARIVPTYFFMSKANVIDKISYANEKRILGRVQLLGEMGNCGGPF